jgi:hypothetical protein
MLLNPPACWQKLDDLQYLVVSLNSVGHQYLAFRIFLAMMFVAK